MKVTNELKAARVLSVMLPPAKVMEAFLADPAVAWREIGSMEISHCGFAVNPATGELVSGLGGDHYHFCIRVDEKVIPSAVVERKLAERIAEHQERFGGKLSRRDKADLKEDVVMSMCLTADFKTRYIHCFYYQGEDHGRLFVSRTGDRDLRRVSALLVRAISSVKTNTIHIDDLALGLTRRVLDAVTNGHTDTNLGKFDLGDRIVIEYGGTRGKLSIADRDLYDCESEIREALNEGGLLREVELKHGDQDELLVRVTPAFHFKSLVFPEVDHSGELEDDYPEHWKHSHGVNLLLMEAMISDLCDMMGYRPPVEAEAQEEALDELV